MPTLTADTSFLLVVDFQARLMPAIADGEAAVANARRLLDAARLFGVPVLVTEENPDGLGPTVPTLGAAGHAVFAKTAFDATREPGFLPRVPTDRTVVVAGCEAHVCVLQTALGLLDAGRRVAVVRDAVGSRRPENKEAGIARMQRHGADVVTAEMVVFEWLATAEHPRFREAIALIK